MKTRKELKAKCAHCGTVVEVSEPNEYKTCKCGKISLDAGDGYYWRMGGNPEDFDKEFDKTNGIERFKQFDPKPEVKTIKPVEEMSYDELNNFETVFGVPVQDMNVLSKEVWEWFDSKGLKDPVMQMVKVQEEVGELAHELSRGHKDTREAVDALGDIIVTIIGMCHHLHIAPAHALSLAYHEIKDRTGKVVEGSFVKDE